MNVNVKWVFWIVGAVLLLAVAGIIALALSDRAIPDVLQNIAVGSLAGMLGLLVPARAQFTAEPH